MKGFKLFFAVSLGLLAFRATGATDMDDTVRAAVRRDATNSTTNVRQKTVSPGQNATVRGNTGRGTSTSMAGREKTTSSQSARTTSSNRTTQTRATAPVRTTVGRGVSERGTTASQKTTRNAIVVPGAERASMQSSGGTATRGIIRTTTTTPTGRSATTKTAIRRSRAATIESGAIMANYARCREVYNQCMDEFCANKDSQLKRCACSSRVNEFDGVKKQLAQVEDKMLDFNQRLLTVNMDAEDVQAMLTATEGENAFYSTEDKTKSKQMLEDISKKLNKAFDSSDDSLGLGAISLSLNSDSAFDTIDSFMGASTATKNGTALYNAALPVCREMAMEVCSDDEFEIAQSGYQMQIEQDCTTVAKAYQTQTDQARTRVFESSALLDISRLDTYQKRNSDDILTCKKKMLDMLTDTTICGADMGKCLDMSGKYIDPTTGEAFLSENLSELSNLITRPSAGEKWTTVSNNSTFVTFLNKKKSLLEPATENCQDIADTVWSEFLEDALAKIKLAQDAKMEEIRQACTTLTTQCLTNAADSITNFDARALSVFGVSADVTANNMCTKVKNSCSALLDDTNWGTGMSNIATNKTFETILSSCTQVGRNCIIQSCRSISSNFGLCQNIQTSPNRHSILLRISCWNEVLSCVASAGDETVNIMELQGVDNFYNELYSQSQSTLFDICQTECGGNAMDEFCAECRIAERIWGNCQYNPASMPTENRIIAPKDGYETLMSWFATNTGTQDSAKSCVPSRCTGHIAYNSNDEPVCITGDDGRITNGDNRYCPTPNTIMTIYENTTNCCFSNNSNASNFLGSSGSTSACCATGNTNNGICLPSDVSVSNNIIQQGNTPRLVCIGDDNLTGASNTNDYPNGNTVNCNGTIVIINNNLYGLPDNYATDSTVSATAYTPINYYYNGQNPNDRTTLTAPDTNIQSWFIDYTQP